MAEGGSTDGVDETGFDYPALVQAALFDVVRRVLTRAAAEGLPGEHHFYLTLGTADDGVVLPARLRKRFPEEMTIVLQNQFWNLTVDDGGFGVTLRFGGAPERLFVPWTALRAFADPSVGFGLRLKPMADSGGPATGEASDATQPAVSEPGAAVAPVPTSTEAAQPAKVVDLGSFRRRSAEAEPRGED